jgi:hypothetical protein
MSAADAILVVHAAFVAFVVLGLPAIWFGAALGARWAFNAWFRGLHLAAIACVVLESLLGYACPLTIWEDALRGFQGERGFLARWVHSWLYWDWPAWVFTTLYVAFGLAVLLTYWRLPPKRRDQGT